MNSFWFLEQTPIYSIDELQIAPWPVHFQIDGIKSFSRLPSAGTIQASPTYATEKAYDGDFFTNVDKSLLNMYSSIKGLLTKHTSEPLFKAALQSANPYTELFGAIFRAKELSTLRFLEFGLSCQLFNSLDRAVRSLLNPAEVGQYEWNFVSVSPHLYLDAVKTYLETRITDVPINQVRTKLPITYTCIHSRKDAPRSIYPKIPFKAVSGPALDGFTQIDQLKNLIVTNTRGQGAHLLLLEYDPTIPSSELYSNYVQYSQLPQFITSVLLAISPKTVKFGGSCIFKSTDFWSPIHTEMLHLCEACYDNVAIYKTACTRMFDTERWVILKGRNKNIYDINYPSFVAAIEKIINVVYPRQPSEPFNYCNSLIAPFLQRATEPLDIFNRTKTPTNLAQYILYTNNAIMTVQTSLYIQALLLHGINRKNYTSLLQFVRDYANVLKFSGVPMPGKKNKKQTMPALMETATEGAAQPIQEAGQIDTQSKDTGTTNQLACAGTIEEKKAKETSEYDSSEMMMLSEESDEKHQTTNSPTQQQVAHDVAYDAFDAQEDDNIEAMSIYEQLNLSIGKTYKNIDIDLLEKYLTTYYSVPPRQVIPYQQYRDRMFGCFREALTLKPDTRSIEYIIGKDTDNPGTNINWTANETTYASTAQLVEREQEKIRSKNEAKMRTEDKEVTITKVGGLTVINDATKPGKPSQEPEIKQRRKFNKQE